MSAVELLTTSEVATLLRVHPKHVYRLLRRGLPARRVGGEWRFARDEVLAWGRTTSQPTASAPLVAGNDPLVLDLLQEAGARGEAPLFGMVGADSGRGLDLLGRGSVLAAGLHGQAAPEQAGVDRLVVLHLVRREVGLAARSRRRLPRLGDVPGTVFAGRPQTAGSRVPFDAALQRLGADPVRANAKARLYGSPSDAASAVASGETRFALTTASAALRAGLSFRALFSESYGLVLRADSLGDPRAARLCEAAQSRLFRRRAAAVPGYDARAAGAVRFDPRDPGVDWLD